MYSTFPLGIVMLIMIWELFSRMQLCQLIQYSESIINNTLHICSTFSLRIWKYIYKFNLTVSLEAEKVMYRNTRLLIIPRNYLWQNMDFHASLISYTVLRKLLSRQQLLLQLPAACSAFLPPHQAPPSPQQVFFCCTGQINIPVPRNR